MFENQNFDYRLDWIAYSIVFFFHILLKCRKIFNDMLCDCTILYCYLVVYYLGNLPYRIVKDILLSKNQTEVLTWGIDSSNHWTKDQI